MRGIAYAATTFPSSAFFSSQLVLQDFYAPPANVVECGRGKRRPFAARLLTNVRTTADDWSQDVRFIEFDVSGTDLK